MKKDVERRRRAVQRKITSAQRALARAQMLLNEACDLDRDLYPSPHALGMNLARPTDAVARARNELARLAPLPLGKGFAE